MNKLFLMFVCALCAVALFWSNQDSLFLTFTKPTIIDFHTPVITSGYFLPTHITKDLSITPNMGTIIVARTTTIEKGAKVTIHPGTTIAVHEYGSIVVKGDLRIAGTLESPIRFISNEVREENRTWSGIMFNQESSGTILHAIVHHASPGISCSNNTNVTVTNTSFALGNLNIFGPCSQSL